MSLRDAAAGGGAALAIVAAVLGFTGGAAVEKAAEPLERAVDALAPAFDPCPSGWEYKPASDEHAQVEGCERDGWRVILADGKFNYAWQYDPPARAFEYDAAKVPGWAQ